MTRPASRMLVALVTLCAVGAAIHANEQIASAVVTAVEEEPVIGPSHSSSRTVVRRDRIDAVSAAC